MGRYNRYEYHPPNRTPATLLTLLFIGLFIALTVADVGTILHHWTGPARQSSESAIGHLWNARRTLNLTLSGQEWILAGEAIGPLDGNPQCRNKMPWDVCKPDFDWDSMEESFKATGETLIELDKSDTDSFTKAQTIQNNQKYIDEAVEHVNEAADFEWGFASIHAFMAGVAWFLFLFVTIIIVIWRMGW